MYHRITHPIRGIRVPTLNVAPDRFREQIAGLQRRGYVFRPLAEILRQQRLGLPMPPRTVVLTFDDGFASVYKNAWPILMELQVPATILLCTAFLDSKSPFPFDAWALTFRRQIPVDSWRPLGSDECHEMQASGLIDFVRIRTRIKISAPGPTIWPTTCALASRFSATNLRSWNSASPFRSAITTKR